MEDYHDQHRRSATQVQSVMHFVMGVILVFIGLYFLFYQKLGINVFNREPSSVDYLIGGLFILYGGWRIYRGVKKKY